MQDRFKFRLWHKPLKIMHYNDFTVTATEYMAKIYQQDDYMMKFNQEDLEFDKQCILMQCTGLKDKNGKLIYEGDIVDKGTRCKWIITWFKNKFILVPDFEYKNKDKCANDRECGFKYFENNHNYADKDDEVIGNIYQNPELLED